MLPLSFSVSRILLLSVWFGLVWFGTFFIAPNIYYSTGPKVKIHIKDKKNGEGKFEFLDNYLFYLISLGNSELRRINGQLVCLEFLAVW